jgi:HSP20 family protein
MNLLNFKAAKELKDISERVGKLFGYSPARASSVRGMLAAPDWRLSVDISETDAEYMISGDIPGVHREDVRIYTQDGMLIVQGERRMEKEGRDRRVHRRECAYGNFARSFLIPVDADENGMQAEFSEGMFHLRLPKAAKLEIGNVVKISVVS